MNAINFSFKDEASLHRFAHIFGQSLRVGDCIALQGDLGAGKTSFTRALVQSLQQGTKDEVPSPTFTLLQTYKVQLAEKNAELWHYDLYRIKEADELLELGLDDALQSAVTIIEWPDVARTLLPADTLFVTIQHMADQAVRAWQCSGSKRWQTILTSPVFHEWTHA